MKSFEWNSSFVTGFDTIDEQHHSLVDLINRFGDELSKDHTSFSDVEAVLMELVNYAGFHFSQEEDYMRANGIDARHLDYHIGAHHQFIDEVTQMLAGFSADNPNSGKRLLEFLNHWLVYHILGVDQNMARQLKQIDSGVDAAEAYESEERSIDQSTGLLLNSLNGMFELVLERNRELLSLNQTLEEKVAQRTRQLEDSNRHLEELSLTDALTQLPNRRHAMRVFEKMWLESVQKDQPLACMMIDADHFKEVNDSCGHDAGDEVLKALARQLRHCFRTDDAVCRLGGDEFFVICPATGFDGAMLVAEQTRSEVAGMRVPTGGEPWHGSISVGVAVRDPDMEGYEALLKQADEGVYAAKRAGKNCVRSIAEAPA